MRTYVIIRNSEDQGMDIPEVFTKYDKAMAVFENIIKEEKEYIGYDDDDFDYEDIIVEDDKFNFVYVDDDGMHETRIFFCVTKEELENE